MEASAVKRFAIALANVQKPAHTLSLKDHLIARRIVAQAKCRVGREEDLLFGSSHFAL